MSEIKVDLYTVYPITEPPFKECPFCGYDEYFYKESVSGAIYLNVRYDKEAAENTDLYEGLRYSPVGKFCYCSNCKHRLFRFRR